MRIEMIDLRKSNNRNIFNKLQPIIVENLVSNGGTLRQANIFTKNYEWTHLFLIKDREKIIGFAILRHSSFDKHNTGFEEYYYISSFVLVKNYQRMSYGTELLKCIIEVVNDLPLVSSVREDNIGAFKIFNRFMSFYSKHGRYYRFMDNKSYLLRGDTISMKYRL